MTITPGVLYLISILDAIVCCSTLIAVFAGVVSFVACCTVQWDFTDESAALRLLKYTVPSFILAVLLAVFVPNTKQAAGIYIIPRLAANQQIQELPKAILDYVSGWLQANTPVTK